MRPEQLLAADLRANEHDRLVGCLGLEHLDELVRLAAGVDRQLELRHGVDRERRGLDLDHGGVVHVTVGQHPDRRRHRGREQGRLAAGGGEREDPLDVLQEAEVEHLVGLVEDHEAAVVEHQGVTGDQVEHTADGAHDDVPARPELCLLGADRRPAEHGHDVDAGVRAVRPQRLGDLDAELARGREHECLHRRLARVDVLHDRQPERGGLAGARLGLADHVPALEQRRDRLFLDRARSLVADVAQGLEGGLREPEIGEGLAHAEGSSRSLPVVRRSRRSTCARPASASG